MCILDLNRVLMQELYYNYIRNKYGNNSRLLFIDTDSPMYEIFNAINKCLILQLFD